MPSPSLPKALIDMEPTIKRSPSGEAARHSAQPDQACSPRLMLPRARRERQPWAMGRTCGPFQKVTDLGDSALLALERSGL